MIRAAFESWMQSEDGNNWPESTFILNPAGFYLYPAIQDAWEAWQASALNTEAHLMQSHEGLMDAASAKHRIEKAERALAHMRSAFFVNMIRAFPEKSSAQVLAEIDRIMELAP